MEKKESRLKFHLRGKHKIMRLVNAETWVSEKISSGTTFTDNGTSTANEYEIGEHCLIHG